MKRRGKKTYMTWGLQYMAQLEVLWLVVGLVTVPLVMEHGVEVYQGQD